MVIQLNGISSNPGPRVRDAAQESAFDRATTLREQPSAANASRPDSVQLSREAQQLYKTENNQTFDEDRVASLRQQIAEGNYALNPFALAGNLLDLESKL